MNNFSIDELLRPFQQTATMCSMVWRDPFVVHGVLPENLGGRRSITDEELADRASDYRVLIASMGL